MDWSGLINAKKEFEIGISELGLTTDDILCASICFNSKDFVLKEKHNNQDIKDFLNFLDIEYDNDYGIRHLFGSVFFKDNSWLEREDYDGSEWWAYRKFEIPEECK